MHIISYKCIQITVSQSGYESATLMVVVQHNVPTVMNFTLQSLSTMITNAQQQGNNAVVVVVVVVVCDHFVLVVYCVMLMLLNSFTGDCC